MIAIAGKKAFQSIQAVLRQDKSEVRLSDLWRAIHDELTIGVRLPGGVLRLDGDDRRRLREYIRGLHGLDPLLDELDGDRVDLAARTSNEKFSAQSGFGGFLRLVSRRPEIHLHTGCASTPPGSALTVDPSLIMAESLGAMAVVVENGAVFSRWAKAAEEGLVALAGFMVHAGVDGGSQQVIGRGDGVDIARQVQVEVFHGDDLAVATTGGATLDPEGGALAGLADAGKHVLAQVGAQGFAQTDHGGRFALTQRGWGNGSYVDVFAIRHILEPLQDLEPHFGLVIAV